MAEPIRLVLAALEARDCRVRGNGAGWTARCPAHDDRTPSLSVSEGDDGRVLLKCHAGCETANVVAALELELADLFGKGGAPLSSVSRRTPEQSRSEACGHRTVTERSRSASRTPAEHPGITLAALAAGKRLPLDFLKTLGCSEVRYQGAPAVRIPYYTRRGEQRATRYRVGLDVEPRFKWKAGSKVSLYGLDRLAAIREGGWCLLVEGESDCWTAWHHGIPALGVPGKSTWRSEWGEHLAGLDVFVWQEPSAEDFTARVHRDLPGVRVIAPDGTKDLSAAHLDGEDVPALLGRLRATAPLASEVVQAAEDAARERLERDAGRVLGSPDPLAVVAEAIKASGYGGEARAPLLTYVAATSRLLEMRRGAMPVHVLLVGPPSAGKSYTVQTALSLLPPAAVVAIDAGSPRALIYGDHELAHRVLVFGEADSLPAGEDNPAASAVRNLLQDHHLHYEVVEQDPETHALGVRHIDKPGPTVLITTAVKRLGEQLTSRLFVLDVADTQDQTRSALATQADIEVHGTAGPDPALVAFQSYLQTLAPWDVVVPFAGALAAAVGRRPAASRVLRDYSRLLALIKCVAVVRHRHRSRDERGRLVAEIADYEAVIAVTGDVFDASVTGAGDTIREVVDATVELIAAGREAVTVSEIAERLGLAKSSASARVRKALAGGWLVNREERRGRAYALVLGEPLPETSALPDPSELFGCSVGVRQVFGPVQCVYQDCSGVRSQTDGGSSLTAGDAEAARMAQVILDLGATVIEEGSE